MDLGDLYNTVGGAILGAIAGMILPSYVYRARHLINDRRASRRRKVLSDNEVVYEWLIRYYDKKGKLSDLYSCKIGDYETRIPFLFKDEWMPPAPLTDGARKAFLKYSDSDENFPVSEKMLKRREKMGQRLFNAPTAHVNRVESAQGSTKLHLMPCSYFELATSIIAFEEETFRAAAGRRWARTPMRDQYLSSATVAAEMLLRPRSLGCAFVLAVKTARSYEVLVHTRSHETVTFGGAKAVTPNFGFEPLSYAQDSSGQGLPDLLIQNFIKEYLEELYNYEDLISVMASRRADPLWFLELPEAQEIIHWMSDGRFEVEVLGFGFDALNGNAVMAALGVIEDEAITIGLKKKLMLNWEVSEGKAGVPDATFVDIKSKDLESWLRGNQYHTGAAFALSNALPSLTSRVGA